MEGRIPKCFTLTFYFFLKFKVIKFTFEYALYNGKGKQWYDEHKGYSMVILFGEGRNEMNYKIQVIIKILSYDLSGGFLSAIALLKLTNEMTTK